MENRQEVLNVLLAQLLQEHGEVVAPEQVLQHPDGSIKLPDVLVDFQGLRLVIEAEIGKSKDKKDRAVKKPKSALTKPLPMSALPSPIRKNSKTSKISAG